MARRPAWQNILISPHVRLYEVLCKQAGVGTVHRDCLDIFEKVRSDVWSLTGKETAITINSGFRTVEHNKKVGGVKGSYHTKGMAVDMACPKSMTLQEFYRVVCRCDPVGGVIAYIDKNFVHMDIRYLEDKPPYQRFGDA